MKNNLTIDLDTDRKSPGQVMIGKPTAVAPPKSAAEFRAMVELDMVTMCEGICTMIHMLEQSGGRKSPASLSLCIEHLQNGFADASYHASNLHPVTDVPAVENEPEEKGSEYKLIPTEKSFCRECGEKVHLLCKDNPGSMFFICFKCRFIAEAGVGPILDTEKAKNELPPDVGVPAAGEAAESHALTESPDGASQNT